MWGRVGAPVVGLARKARSGFDIAQSRNRATPYQGPQELTEQRTLKCDIF
jgi:hypothetical protein